MQNDGPWKQPGADYEPERGEPNSPVTSVEAFTFSGNWREYFGIWIVNILLTIVTLGIYSAWAKVRRQRYFYGNTRLAGSGFEYHARPMQILIGRLIVFAVLIGYNLLLMARPVEAPFAAILFVFAVPWFVSRGLRFNARVTSYRNVRFDFAGGYGGAFKAYLLGGIITWFSLGILAPVASRWMWRYTFNNLTYGGRPFASDPALRPLYRQWMIPAGVVFGGFAVVGISALGLSAFFTDLVGKLMAGEDADELLAAIMGLTVTALIPILIFLGLAALAYMAGVRNVVFNATTLDGRHRLRSAIGRRRFVFITVTNVLATFASFGLARPWAAVRMAKYLAAATALEVGGSLDDYLSTVKDTGAAVGAEYMDVEGIDIGF